MMFTKNFTVAELACRHCGAMHITPRFGFKVQKLRDESGFPMPVSSGYRCPVHNQAVSSTGPDGPHTKDALDVKVYGYRAFLLVDLAIKHKFTGIGIKQHGPHADRFVHLDDLPDEAGQPRPWIWSYP